MVYDLGGKSRASKRHLPLQRTRTIQPIAARWAAPAGFFVIPAKTLREEEMKIFIGILFGVLLCSGALAGENDFRCFKSVGLKHPLKLQFDFPSENQDLGYVTYQNGSGKIPIKNINVKEIRAVPGRSSEFKAEWQEVTPDNSGGKYIVVSQGARVYEFQYIRKKGRTIFKFEEDLESSDEEGCKWNKK